METKVEGIIGWEEKKLSQKGFWSWYGRNYRKNNWNGVPGLD